MTGSGHQAEHLQLSAVAVELIGPAELADLAARLSADTVMPGTDVTRAHRADPDETLPLRRRRAIEAAKGAIVCLVEDTTRLAPGWDSVLGDAFRDPAVAMVSGPVTVDTGLPARFRALGRLEYGRFDGAQPGHDPAGNAFALRRDAVLDCLGDGEGVIEHEVARRLSRRGARLLRVAGLQARYWRADSHGAALTTRFGHGRIYGAGRAGNRLVGAGRAILALPLLSMRALRAARAAGPARLWLPELPWILAMSAAWCAGEFTGQVFGPGNAERSWR